MQRVGLIGLGKIASFEGRPTDAEPFCHAGGINLSRQVTLVSVAGRSEKSRQDFQQLWGPSFPGLHVYSSADTMLKEELLDIVAICVRGPDHFDLAMKALEFSPRALFIEKPATCSLGQMDALMVAAQRRNTAVTVSYTRHWAPKVRYWERRVAEGLLGRVETIVAFQGGPIVSDAVHTTDLICQFAMGRPVSVQALSEKMEPASPGYDSDPHLKSMVIEFENGVTGIQLPTSGGQPGYYCDVYGTKGHLRVGMSVPTVLELWSKNQGTPEPKEPASRSAFLEAYEDIARHLAGGPLPCCTDRSFMIVNELVFAAAESVYSGKREKVPCGNRLRRIDASW